MSIIKLQKINFVLCAISLRLYGQNQTKCLLCYWAECDEVIIKLYMEYGVWNTNRAK